MGSSEIISEKIAKATKAYQKFMDVLGIPVDANSKETAFRVAKMFVNERCSGMFSEPPKLTSFPKDDYEEYVVVKDIPFYSMCSHHHVTFFGKAHICYFPKDKVVGISKLARVVQHFSAKPQIQELLTSEISNYLWEHLDPLGLAVKMEARHMCMESRGAKVPGAFTVTQKIRGNIDKAEILKLFE